VGGLRGGDGLEGIGMQRGGGAKEREGGCPTWSHMATTLREVRALCHLECRNNPHVQHHVVIIM
jgi:hypothetical protein